MDVFLLWHVRETPSGAEDAKLIGAYATADDAERARQRVADQPGFRDSPEGFEIGRYEVGRGHWTEGFVSASDREKRPAEPGTAPDRRT